MAAITNFVMHLDEKRSGLAFVRPSADVCQCLPGAGGVCSPAIATPFRGWQADKQVSKDVYSPGRQT